MTDEETKIPRVLDAVRRWLAALEARDADALLDATSPVIELVVRSGELQGHDAVRAWVAEAGHAATNLRWYAGPDTAVVEQLAAWTPKDPETAAAQAGVRIALAFSVLDGLVTRMQQFDDVGAALHEAWLTPEDSVDSPHPA